MQQNQLTFIPTCFYSQVILFLRSILAWRILVTSIAFLTVILFVFYEFLKNVKYICHYGKKN